MKFLATVGVLASAAIAVPNPEPFCSQPGQPCWKVTRAAAAFADSMKFVGGLESRDEHGIPNEIALSAINGLDQLSTMILYASEDPSAFRPYGENGTETREVEVQEDKRWCYRPGEPCWVPKRTDEISEEKRGCFQNGGDCQKAKRVAEAVLAATIEGDEKRSVEVESPEKRMCNSVGQPCWKAQRDLELIQNLARAAVEGMY
ncbi:hypothetical protein M431DRAFT_86570 [Trichoderma harzianum CBS 226.95]|uniref:Clock-controlled pheromone ccg-4 n=1 Tax=Trichoderma harzianum CBS 226.95 TaxID=983964 RepID=A0A2T4AA35_TRIHA|nr:hypothetical protein M431DRAFT_86570 [Trichoderma harzianum CBS 226.95]PTB53931.1 hypothetical protein M431DRAFT_86570 [Trichoderma harzianum CBS 226.95]